MFQNNLAYYDAVESGAIPMETLLDVVSDW